MTEKSVKFVHVQYNYETKPKTGICFYNFRFWLTQQNKACYGCLQIGHSHFLFLLVASQSLASPEDADDGDEEDDDIDEDDAGDGNNKGVVEGWQCHPAAEK